MRRAGFRYVFLGIENVLDDDLAFLQGAREERAARATAGRSATRRIEAIEHLHRHGMFVVGGLIVGNPDDTRESIEANLDVRAAATSTGRTSSIRRRIRGTPMTRDFRERGLIVDEDVEQYDGTTAVVRTRAPVGADEIEFLRWRAERWMKVRHMPAAFRHDPRFVLTHARADVRAHVPAEARGGPGWAWNRTCGVRTLSRIAPA